LGPELSNHNHSAGFVTGGEVKSRGSGSALLFPSKSYLASSFSCNKALTSPPKEFKHKEIYQFENQTHHM
jgi:hypothetical protein